MARKFNCNSCKYNTDIQCNYNKHLQTKKHTELIINKNLHVKNPPVDSLNNNIKQLCRKKISHSDKVTELKKKSYDLNNKLDELSDTDKNNIICEFCNLKISFKRHLKRHYNTCIRKKTNLIENNQQILVDNLFKEKDAITSEKDRLAAYAHKLETEKRIIEETYRDYVTNTHITMNKLIDKGVFIKEQNSIGNMNIFFVTNNYINAKNYEDVMGKALTEEEKQDIIENGPTTGCYNLIHNRCIRDLSKEERPIHCLDASRDKYVVRTNNVWVPDLQATKILETAFKPVREVMYAENNKIKETDINTFVKNQGLLLDMDINGGKQIMKHIRKEIQIKDKTKIKEIELLD